MSENTPSTARDIARSLKEKTGIEIPQDIVEFYSTPEANFKKSFLYHNYKDIEKGQAPYTVILIAEKFAKKIIELLEKFVEKHGFETLLQQLMGNEYSDIGNDIKVKGEKIVNTEEQYLELDAEKYLYSSALLTIDDYDFQQKKFRFPLVQEAFEQLHSDNNLLKCIWILSVDCGGESGLIVQGHKTGHIISYYHGAYEMDIIHKGKTIGYQGFLGDKWENPYL